MTNHKTPSNNPAPTDTDKKHLVDALKGLNLLSRINLCSTHGTIEQWREHVARFAVGNSRISFAISASFTAPLLDLLGIEGGGFHFSGHSATGKTIMLNTAGSVWDGHNSKTMWPTGVKKIEKIAHEHNGRLLLLDEMGLAKPQKIGQMVHTLANGQAKQRANDVRLKEWRLLFLSTGELDLKTVMQSAGDTANAGHEVRMIDLEAVTGEYGVFDTLLDGYQDSKTQAEALQANTSKYYGTAGNEFLAGVIKDIDEAKLIFEYVQSAFTDARTPKNADWKLKRVIKRFAIVAAGGELATYLGVTGWERGEALRSVGQCFDSWKGE